VRDLFGRRGLPRGEEGFSHVRCYPQEADSSSITLSLPPNQGITQQIAECPPASLAPKSPRLCFAEGPTQAFSDSYQTIALPRVSEQEEQRRHIVSKVSPGSFPPLGRHGNVTPDPARGYVTRLVTQADPKRQFGSAFFSSPGCPSFDFTPPGRRFGLSHCQDRCLGGL